MTKDIIYCMRSTCSRATTCLRHLAYQHTEPFFHHSFLDPRTSAVGEECTQYLSNRVYRVGRGFKGATRLVQYGSIRHLQGRICYELGCGRSHYYRYASGEQPLTDEQQEAVRSVFEEFGVVRPDLFDSYEDAYYLPY